MGIGLKANSRLNVTHVLADGQLGGAQRSVQWMAKALDRSRVNARFVFLYGRGPVFDEIANMGYPTKVLNWTNGWSIAGRVRLLQDLLRSSADLLHFHDTTPLVRAIARFATAAPVLFTQHGVAAEEVRNRHLLSLSFMRLDDRSTRLVLANSRFTAQAHARYYGRAPSNIHVLYLGLDVGRFASVNGSPPAHANSKPVLLFVGRAEKYKGVLELPKLARELIGRGNSNFTIRVVGDGAALLPLERAIQNEGLAGHVKILGAQTHVLPELLAADLFVFPSLCNEAFGIAPLEAVAAGLPVVAYDVGAVREVLADAPATTLVACGDIAALAEAVMRTLRSGSPLRGEEGFNYVRSRFGAERYASELIGIYEQILKRR
jgi:glycosyltransferase involved in cell wall biosynthesis